MSEHEVRIVHMEPMRVASAHGFGPSPEGEAMDKLLGWAKAQGLLDDRASVRFFGFNNPDPSPGSPNYGYEQWMTVGPQVEAQGEVQIKEVPSGRYAVLRCDGLETIGEDWRRLVVWVEDSAHQMAQRQCLEELLSAPDAPAETYSFDLYLAITD